MINSARMLIRFFSKQDFQQRRYILLFIDAVGGRWGGLLWLRAGVRGEFRAAAGNFCRVLSSFVVLCPKIPKIVLQIID